MKTRLQGSFLAMVTPFDRSGAVDFGAFKELIETQQAHGTDALFIMGTSGESGSLTVEEKKRVVVETARIKSGKLPIFYGFTGCNTQDTIERVKFAKDNGADGVILTVPVYMSPSNSEAEAYFLEVADATDLPLGIYNNPARLNTDMHWDQLLRIFKHPNYVVYKESGPRGGQIAQLLRAAPDISLMCDSTPDPGNIPQTMLLGGDGFFNSAGHLAPEEFAALAKPFTKDTDIAAFRELYLRMVPLLWFTFSARSPIPLKSLMKAVGLPVGEVRRPLRPLEPARVAEGVAILRELGLIEKYGYRVD